MHRSNETFMALTNEHCSFYENLKYDESTGISQYSSQLSLTF
jgi:hypothetical protein